MLNLVVQRQDVVHLDRGGVTGICVDSGHVYVIYANAAIQCLEDRGNKITWEAFLPEGCGDLVDSRYLIDLDALCVCTSAGGIFLFNGDDGLVEEVGEVEGGIAGAEWSPDEELLVLLTRGAKLIVMTKEWSVLQEMEVIPKLGLSGKEGKDTYQIDVTWRGDAQYFATSVCSSVDRHVIVWDRSSLTLHAQAECESHISCVAWQPNGRHLYTSTISNDGSCIVLYEKNGIEHGKFSIRASSKVTTMKWSPDSQLLGIIVEGSSSSENQRILQVWRRSNWHWYLKYESWWPTIGGDLHICWDEKDLKLHVVTGAGTYTLYEFGLDVCVSARGSAAVVDGNQLKVSSFRNAIIPPPMATVCVQFPSAIQTVSFLDGEDVEGVAVCLASGNLGLAVCSDEDNWEDLETDLEDDDSGDADHYGALSSLSGKIVSGVHLVDLTSPIHSIIWASKLEIVAALSLAGKQSHKIVRFQLAEQEGSWKGKQVVQGSEASGAILQCSVVSGQIITALHDGGVVHHSEHGSTRLLSFPEPCQRLCTSPSMPAIPGTNISGVVGLSRNGCMYFGGILVSTGVTSVGIRSEGPGGPFILYTTKANQLHLLQLSQLSCLDHQASSDTKNTHSVPGIIVGKNIVRSGPTRDMHAAMRPAAAITNQQSLNIRQVEQGSRIVSIAPGGTRVVLQMPRGNLETIHPRILVLCTIADCLNKEMYNEAWDLASTNRVDLNIIVDYNWPQFLQGAKAFVSCVEREQDICDLVMALKPGSVLDDENGLYRTAPLPLPSKSPDIPAESLEGGKIASICMSLRSTLMDAGTTEYLQAIVTTFVRSDPPDLEAALKCIKAAREAELEALKSLSAEKGVVNEKASGALKHLMLYVNTNSLYEIALGMYDLELAYMVVTNAQMDPAEYLVELQRFASFHPPNYQRYYIDMHLRRFPEALENLVKSGNEHFDGCLDLAKQKGLLHELLALVDECEDGDNGNQRLRVLRTSAEWLLDQNMHDDAAVAFLAAEEIMKAFEAYKKGCCWEMCLSLAGKLKMDDDQIRNCAMDLLDELKSDRRLQDAAKVALQYLEDIDEAVLLLSDARNWREALRVAYRYDREDLVETVVAPAAAECASTSLTSFIDDTERLSKYWNRLKEVRAKRHAMEAVIGNTGNTEIPEYDAMDELARGEDGASTVAGMSIYTERTYANATLTTASTSAFTTGGKKPQRRKKKKKGLRIRQGSPEEERALCEHIKNLTPSNQVCEEIGQLMELLILLTHEKDARTLQHALDTLIKGQKEASDDIQKNPPPDPPKTERSSIQDGPRWKLDILRGTMRAK